MFERTREGIQPRAPSDDPHALRRLKRSGRCQAAAYDVVVNGYELGGGSLRIHNEEMQSAVFDVLAMDSAAQAKFGFLLDALVWLPPHGGIALADDWRCDDPKPINSRSHRVS